jgi:hypothetical protein
MSGMGVCFNTTVLKKLTHFVLNATQNTAMAREREKAEVSCVFHAK